MINRAALPPESGLANPAKPYNYCDSYAAPVRADRTAAGAAWDFFTAAPDWVSTLMALRNRIVSWFGLKTGEGGMRVERSDLKAGQKVGLFRVYSVSDTEVILGEDDRHLNFRVSVLVEKPEGPSRMLFVSTVVHYNNTFGRLYFFFVRPVHKIIVPAMFRKLLSREARAAQSS